MKIVHLFTEEERIAANERLMKLPRKFLVHHADVILH